MLFIPATYAHYSFGCEVIPLLPKGIRAIINAHRQLFNIGLHGPDILFYYQPYHKNAISSRGYAMHDELASDFFAQARKIYANNQDGKEEMLAYLLGFVAHFALDYSCHSYVEAIMHQKKVSHTLVETCFDRYLLVEDGYDPLSFNTTGHLEPSIRNAKIIARFFPGIKWPKMHKVLKSMVFYLRLLIAPNPVKRNSLLNVMKVAGVYHSLKDQLIPLEENEDLTSSCLGLASLKYDAQKLYVKLAVNLFGYLNGQNDLDPAFSKTFEKQDGWEKICI